MNLLSLNFGHDASIAYFHDGRLASFEELERRSRLKSHFGMKALYVEEFLQRLGVALREVDLVAISGTQGWGMAHCDRIRLQRGLNPLHARLAPDVAIWETEPVGTMHTVIPEYASHVAEQGLTRITQSPVMLRLPDACAQGTSPRPFELERVARGAASATRGELQELKNRFLTPYTIAIDGWECPPDAVAAFIADRVAQGKVLCLQRGRSEVGPRALGRRSIIAHAVSAQMRDRINSAKGREPWRPLAPLCRVEDFADYFDGSPELGRYMLFTCCVLRDAIPAVTHVDGSARVQCVTTEDVWLHPALGMLRECGLVPVVINTSFNVAGEPLVETLEHAIRSFLKMKFDYLVTDGGVYEPAP